MSPIKQMLAGVAQNTLKMNALKGEISVLEAKNIEIQANIIIAVDNAVGSLQERIDKIVPLKLEKKKTH